MPQQRMRTTAQQSGQQSGFSLMELAFALTIIGILLGIVLKGRELITNARINFVIRQVSSYQSATKIFESTYRDLPGDLVNPGARIPTCTTAPCTTSGNGDGMITSIIFSQPLPDSYLGIMGIEHKNFWVHLAKAGLISGIDPNNTSASFTGWGNELPGSSFGNMGFIVNGPYIPRYSYTLMLRPPNLTTMPGSINGLIGQQIDIKMDDGMPNTGTLQQFPYSFNCVTGVGTSAQYNVQLESSGCYLLFTSN